MNVDILWTQQRSSEVRNERKEKKMYVSLSFLIFFVLVSFRPTLVMLPLLVVNKGSRNKDFISIQKSNYQRPNNTVEATSVNSFLWTQAVSEELQGHP